MLYAIAEWNLAAEDRWAKVCALRDAGFEALSFVLAPPEKIGDRGTAQALLDLGVQALVHGRLPSSKDAGAAAKFPDEIERCAHLRRQTERLRAVCFDPAATDAGFDLPATVAGLKAALDALSGLGVRVGVENWLRNSDLAHWKAVQDSEVGGRIGMLLDIGHANLHCRQTGRDVAEYIAALPLPILELHVHDNDGKTDQHLPLGEGNAEYARSFAAVKDRGFDGIVTIEVCPYLKGGNFTGPDSLEPWKRTLDIARRCLEA